MSGLRGGGGLGGGGSTGGATAAEWGLITGTLSDQTDLQSALDAKENSGTAAAAVAAHVADPDPHTQYQKESEKSAAGGYASLDSGTLVPTVELGGAGADGTKFLRGDQTWAVPPGGSGAADIVATTVNVSSPAKEASFTIIDAAITGSSQINVGWGNCSQSDANHPGMGQVGFNAVAGTGQFTVELYSLDNSYLFGEYKLNYLGG